MIFSIIFSAFSVFSMEKTQWPLMQNVYDNQDKIELVEFILSTDRYTYGPKIKEFENNWNQWLGTKYSVMVNSGSSANLILIDAIKEKYLLKNNDKILVPACTWVTNISPIIQNNLEPVFCDINLKNYSFDEKHLSEIVKIHPDIKAVFITHLLGLPSDIGMLKEYLPNAILLEDCCESHGAEYNGQKVGTLAEGSTFSFFYGHHLTTIEGGMVSTDDYELYELLCLKRSHGLTRDLPFNDFKSKYEKYSDIDPEFLFLTNGYNVRSTEINAFLGIKQLKKLDSYIEKRRENFKLFMDLVSRYDEYFYLPSGEGNSSYAFPLIAKDKKFFDALKENLSIVGIETRPIVGSNLLRQPFLKKYAISSLEKFKNADILHFQGLYIGNNQFLEKSSFNLLYNVIGETVGKMK